MEENNNIPKLIHKHITDTLNPEEKAQLDTWIAASEANRKLYNKLRDTSYQRKKLKDYQSFDKEGVREALENQLFGKQISLFSQRVTRYAAAILIPLLLAGGIAMFFRQAPQMNMANIDENIKPGVQKATLLLSDGSSIELDEAHTEAPLEDAGVSISNRNQQLNYQRKKITLPVRHKPTVYNELKTPRGGGYKLQLADGSQVWLNAGSALKYPVEFTDSIRQVFISGEAYFDISHNGKPFVVSTPDMNIRVLGTQFNVTAYADEEDITTTLVEGKVAISLKADSPDAGKPSILTPGLQAVANKDNSQLVVNPVTTTHYTSWKEGKLEFTNQNLNLVMKRLARWYDFEYRFANEAAKSYHFSARINSDESISGILNMLEMTTQVNFEFKNNTIVIN